MVVKYDSNQGLFLTSMKCAHTIVPDVLRRCDFWLLLAVHICLAIGYRTGWILERIPDFGEKRSMFGISWDDIKVISSMTTFFEVFYTNQCFARYVCLYGISGKMISCGCETALLYRLHLYRGASTYMRLGTRFTLASIFLSFYEVHDNEVTDSEFNLLVDQGLLRPAEREILQKMSNQQHAQLLLYWAGDVGKEGLHVSAQPPNALKLLMDPLLRLRAEQQELIRVVALPIPFQYYHLLNAMVLINLILWGYAMAICDSMFASVIYVMASIIFMGMMELADELLMPFGTDEVDFPTKDWLDDLLEAVEVILNGEYNKNRIDPGQHHSWEGVIKTEGATKFKTSTWTSDVPPPRDLGR